MVHHSGQKKPAGRTMNLRFVVLTTADGDEVARPNGFLGLRHVANPRKTQPPSLCTECVVEMHVGDGKSYLPLRGSRLQAVPNCRG